MSRVNLFTISDKLNKAFPTVDTVGILKDLGVDYFSHPYSGLKPLDQTMFRDLWNQWRSCGSSGADLRIELATNAKRNFVIIALTSEDYRIISRFPFSEDGLKRAIQAMKEF